MRDDAFGAHAQGRGESFLRSSPPTRAHLVCKPNSGNAASSRDCRAGNTVFFEKSPTGTLVCRSMTPAFTARVAYITHNRIASYVHDVYNLGLVPGFGGPLDPRGAAARRAHPEAAGRRTGRERSVIARWEQGAVSPSIDNLIAVVHACGFELPLVLVPRDTSRKSGSRRTGDSHPSDASTVSSTGSDPGRRAVAEKSPTFDPRGLLSALDRHRVDYIIVGAFARVVARCRRSHRAGSTSSRPRGRTTCDGSTPR